MKTCQQLLWEVFMFVTFLTSQVECLTKIRLQLDFATEETIDIVFGEPNTLTFDIDIVAQGDGLQTGADLAMVAFLASGGSNSLIDDTKKTPDYNITLSDEQNVQVIQASPKGHGETEIVNTFTSVDVILDFTGTPGCYDTTATPGNPYELICIYVDSVGERVTDTVVPDTYCIELDSCKSIITEDDSGVPTLTEPSGADIDIIYGTSKTFDLEISTTPTDNTETADLPLAAFAVEVFIATSVNGDNATHTVNATLDTPTTAVTPSTEFIIDFTATLPDLSGLNCEVHTHVCVSINPDVGAPWQWGSGTDPKIACSALTCTSEIEADPVPIVTSNPSGDLDIVMGITTESFNLDITLTTGHHSAEITDDVFDMFTVVVYLASANDGSDPTDKVDGVVSSQDVTIEPDVGSEGNPVVINVVAEDMDTTDLNCDDYSYICANITSKIEDVWTWANASTDAIVSCVAISTCIGNITADVTLANNGGGSLEVELGEVIAFDLDIAIDVIDDSALVDNNGNNMFNIKVYLSGDDVGSNASPKMDATGISSSEVVLSTGVGATTLASIQADVNTDGFSCAVFTHVCVDVEPKSTAPYESWQWSDEMVKVACYEFDDCTIQVTDDTITVEPNAASDLDIIMGITDEEFILDITILTGSETGEIMDSADELFDIQIYVASDDIGTTDLNKGDAIVSEYNVTIDTVANTTGITATLSDYDLTGRSCADYSYICIDMGPVGVQWAWNDTVDPHVSCVPIGTCTSSITDGDISITSDDLTIDMGKRKVFDLEVTIPVVEHSAAIEGDANVLFSMHLYLWHNELNTTSKPVRADVISETVTMTEGSDTVISSVRADIGLFGLSCDDYTDICVSISPEDEASWVWHDKVVSVEACELLGACTTQVEGTSIAIAATSGTDLDIVMGTTSVYYLDITINTGEETGLITDNGDNLFDIEFFLFQSSIQDGGSRSHVTAAVPTYLVTLKNSSMTELINVNNTDYPDDLLGLECSAWTSLCVAITPASAEWTWADSIVSYQACTSITGCTTVLTPASEPVIISAHNSAQISIAMGASETVSLDISIGTAGTNTGKLSDAANALFSINIYLAADSSGANSSAKMAATVPSTSVTIAENDQSVISGVVATFDLTVNVCEDYSHICADVTPASNEWSWFDHTDPEMGCSVIEVCTTAPTIDVSVANNANGDLTVQMGESNTFNFDVTITETSGDAVTGTDLYTINAYIATDSMGSNPKPSSTVSASIPDNTIGFSDGTPAELINVQAVMDFSSVITCQQATSLYYSHACVDLSENSGANPLWSMTSLSTSTACVQLTSCSSQTILSFDLSALDVIGPTNGKVTQGENVDVTFDVTITSTPSSSSVTGNDNWKIKGFLAETSTGGSPTTKVESTAASMEDHVGQNLNGGASYEFTSVIVTLPPQSECGNLGYFCVELTQGDGADWFFDPFDSSLNTLCTAVTCGAAAGNMVCVSILLSILGTLVSLWFNV